MFHGADGFSKFSSTTDFLKYQVKIANQQGCFCKISQYCMVQRLATISEIL